MALGASDISRAARAFHVNFQVRSSKCGAGHRVRAERLQGAQEVLCDVRPSILYGLLEGCHDPGFQTRHIRPLHTASGPTLRLPADGRSMHIQRHSFSWSAAVIVALNVKPLTDFALGCGVRVR